MQLDDRDAAILDFEQRLAGLAGAKDAAIRDAFDMTTIRYDQVFNHLIDRASRSP